MVDKGGLQTLLTTLAQFSLAREIDGAAGRQEEGMGLRHLFTEHPSALGETYPEHMRASLSYAVPLFGAAMAATLHAVFPFLFTTTASVAVKRLYERMTRRCVTCPSGRLHRPDLFVGRPAPAVYEPMPMYEI